MKKSMFLLGIAAAALASCTNEEVVEVAQNRAIGFSTFVNNGTRTEVTEVTTDKLTKFYAFGVNANENSGWTDLFDNTEVTVSGTDGTPEDTRYWAVDKEHRFAAYSDGNSKISTNVTYNETNQVFLLRFFAQPCSVCGLQQRRCTGSSPSGRAGSTLLCVWRDKR